MIRIHNCGRFGGFNHMPNLLYYPDNQWLGERRRQWGPAFAESPHLRSVKYGWPDHCRVKKSGSLHGWNPCGGCDARKSFECHAAFLNCLLYMLPPPQPCVHLDAQDPHCRLRWDLPAVKAHSARQVSLGSRRRRVKWIS